MLFGRAQLGGLVNAVTKRPRADAYYSLQQQFGSYESYRTLLDATKYGWGLRNPEIRGSDFPYYVALHAGYLLLAFYRKQA